MSKDLEFSYGKGKDYDKTKKNEVLNTAPQNASVYQETENSRQKQNEMHEPEYTSESIKERGSNLDESIFESNKLGTGKKCFKDGNECSTESDFIPFSASDISVDAPSNQKLQRKENLIEYTETAETSEEFEKEKIHVYSDTYFKDYVVIDEALPSNSHVAMEIPREEDEFHNMSIKKDETKKKEVLNSVLQNTTVYQETEISRKRQNETHEREHTSDSIKECESISNENILESNRPATSKKCIKDIAERNTESDTTSPSVSNLVINAPPIQNLQMNENLMEYTKTTEASEELGKGRTQVCSDTYSNDSEVIDKALPSVSDTETLKEEEAFHNMPTEKDEKENEFLYSTPKNVSVYQETNNYKGKQNEMHEWKYASESVKECRLNHDENILESYKSGSNKKCFKDGVECNTQSDTLSPNISDDTINASPIQKLQRKENLIKATGKTETSKEYEKGRIQVCSDAYIKDCVVVDKTLPSGVDVATGTPKEKEIFHNMSTKNAETKKNWILNSTPQNVTVYKEIENKETNNSKRKQNETQKLEYTPEDTKEHGSNSDENILESNKLSTSKNRFKDGGECNTDNDTMSPSESVAMIDKSPVEKLQRKERLIKGVETTNTRNEFVIGKTHVVSVYSDSYLKDYVVIDKAYPSGSDVSTLTLKGEQFLRKLPIHNCEKTDIANIRKAGMAAEPFSSTSNQVERMVILDDAVKDFIGGNNYPRQFPEQSNAITAQKISEDDRNPTSEEARRCPFDYYESSPDIKTFEESLRYFGLGESMQRLEKSLEEVRRNRNTIENHEELFKHIDKEIQKLSYDFHPDRVQNRGGKEKDLEIAQKLQTALNATRTVLKFLNSAFTEDIVTDHRFGFYTKLNISSLCNEAEVRNRIHEVIFKISVISEIKQQKIISVIHKFLAESKECVRSFLDRNIKDFEKYRDSALFYLKSCIKGFRKLCNEFEEIQMQCREEKNDDNILSLIQTMANDSKRDLGLLEFLYEKAKTSVKGKYQFYSPKEDMDPYFVLPLVSYTNVILMCDVMVRRPSLFNFRIFHSDPYFNKDLDYLIDPFYLASYFDGRNQYEKYVWQIFHKMQLIQSGYLLHISKEKIKVGFHMCIKNTNEIMESKFKIEDYNKASGRNLLMLDIEKCMKMMAEFHEIKQQLSTEIKEFQEQTKNINEKLSEMREANKELDLKIKETLEVSEKWTEEMSNVLSDKL